MGCHQGEARGDEARWALPGGQGGLSSSCTGHSRALDLFSSPRDPLKWPVMSPLHTWPLKLGAPRGLASDGRVAGGVRSELGVRQLSLLFLLPLFLQVLQPFLTQVARKSWLGRADTEGGWASGGAERCHLLLCPGHQREGLVAPVSPSSGSRKWDPGLWGRASQTCPQRSGLCQAQAALLRPGALGWPVIGEEVGSEPQEQLSAAIWGLCGASAGEDSVGDRGSQRPGPEGLVPQSHVTQARGPDGNPPAREAGPRDSPGEPLHPYSCPIPSANLEAGWALPLPGSGPREGTGLRCSARMLGRGSRAALQHQGRSTEREPRCPVCAGPRAPPLPLGQGFYPFQFSRPSGQLEACGLPRGVVRFYVPSP